MCVLRTHHVIQQGHRGGLSHAHEVCSVVCINSIRLLALSIAVVLGKRRLQHKGNATSTCNLKWPCRISARNPVASRLGPWVEAVNKAPQLADYKLEIVLIKILLSQQAVGLAMQKHAALVDQQRMRFRPSGRMASNLPEIIEIQ